MEKRRYFTYNLSVFFFLEQIQRYQGYLNLYTDGSRSENGVGAALVVNNESHYWTLNPMCSIFTAELYAIWQAMLYFSFQGNSRCLICVDSLSAIKVLENRFTQNEWAIKIIETYTYLKSINKEVTIMWIPSHVNIVGNVLADSAAKHATTGLVDEGIPVPLDDIKKAIKQNLTNVWQEQWDRYDGQLKRIKPSIKKWIYPKDISRREQVVLCRMRIGHTNLTHLYLLAGSARPRCETCRVRLTVQHIFTCPIYEPYRRQSGIVSPEMEIALKNEKDSIQHLLTFMKLSGLFKKI